MPNDRARRLRRNPTEEERILWAELRKRRVAGLKFRRQHPLGPYIVDFVNLERRLVIEVDGTHHGQGLHAVRDEARSEWLRKAGYRIYRVWNSEVSENLAGVVDTMLGELGLMDAARPVHPHPDPPPVRGREGK